MRYSKADIEQARGYLLESLKPGDTVYTILRQVSRSGMSRHISAVIRTETGTQDITHLVAKVLGERRNDNDGGIVSSGCGMDMGFELVCRLGYALWPEGFGELSEATPLHNPVRPQTKEIAARAVSKGYIFHGQNGDTSGWNNDGGYALKQRWL